MTSVFYPQGPISDGDQVIMCYWDGNEFYVLTDVPSNPFDTTYIYQPGVVIDSSGKSISVPSNVQAQVCVFTLTGTQSNFVATQTYPSNGYLGITNSGGNTYFNKNTAIPTNFQANQSIYFNWGDPTIGLAGVQYNITSQDNTNPIKSYFYVSPTSAELRQVSPFFLPVTYYNNCTTSNEPYGIGSTCQQTKSTPQNSIINGYCSISGNLDTQLCSSAVGAVWTTVQDALDNHTYVYCPASKTVCSPDCKAPCGDGYQYCQWSGTQMECVFNPNALFSGEWWKKPWFIILVVVFLFILLLLIIIILGRK